MGFGRNHGISPVDWSLQTNPVRILGAPHNAQRPAAAGQLAHARTPRPPVRLGGPVADPRTSAWTRSTVPRGRITRGLQEGLLSL